MSRYVPEDDEVEFEERQFPRPYPHKAKVSFNIRRDLRAFLRNEYPSEVNEKCLVKDFNPEFLPDGPYAILLTTSNCHLGVEKEGKYNPYKDFSFKIRKVNEGGTIAEAAPPISLAITVTPQYDGADTSNNHKFNCPFGPGTQITVQTTGVERSEEFLERVNALLSAIGLSPIERSDLVDGSRKISTIEASHRFCREKFKQVVETVADTKTLIEESENDMTFIREYDNGDIRGKLTSRHFDRLGFRVSKKVHLKAYTANMPDPDSVIRNPRIEATLTGLEEKPRLDKYESLLTKIREIVNSHCIWSGLTTDDLVKAGDPLYDRLPSELSWSHPSDRREQLRECYENRLTAVRAEALKSHTMAVYDIMKSVIERGRCGYQHLCEKTGLSYSSVQRHVRRLTNKGILSKEQGAVTWITYSSKSLLKKTKRIFKRIYPGDMDRDLSERAEERRSRRQETESEEEEENTESEKEEEENNDVPEGEDSSKNPDALSLTDRLTNAFQGDPLQNTDSHPSKPNEDTKSNDPPPK